MEQSSCGHSEMDKHSDTVLKSAAYQAFTTVERWRFTGRGERKEFYHQGEFSRISRFLPSSGDLNPGARINVVHNLGIWSNLSACGLRVEKNAIDGEYVE